MFSSGGTRRGEEAEIYRVGGTGIPFMWQKEEPRQEAASVVTVCYEFGPLVVAFSPFASQCPNSMPSFGGGNAQSLDLLSCHLPTPACLAASGRSRQEATFHLRICVYSFLRCERLNALAQRYIETRNRLAEAWCNPELSGVGVAVNIQTPIMACGWTSLLYHNSPFVSSVV